MNFLLGNPIFVKCCRERLRKKPVAIISTLTLIVSLFLFFTIYLSNTHGVLMVDAKAAGTILPVFVVFQGIALLFMGTASVAGGIAMEKDGGNLDFHRLTPMPVMSKVIGFLFGLPVREYFVFLLTAPFVAISAVLGPIPIYKIILFYMVFFTSVWICHLAGFAVGIISKKPRQVSSVVILGLVSLYIFTLPSWETAAGFIRFLTPIPTFVAFLAWNNPVFSTKVSMGAQKIWLEFAYTLLTQIFFIFVFFVVVYRKWINESHHAFSKKQSVIFFGYLQFLLVTYLGLQFSNKALPVYAIPTYTTEAFSILYIFFFASAIFTLAFIEIISPNFDTLLKGLRRAKKLGLKEISSNTDADSNFLYVVSYALFTMIAYLSIIVLAYWQHLNWFVSYSVFGIVVIPTIFTLSLYLYVAALREFSTQRDFFLSLFYLWVVPLLVMLLYMAATGGNSEAIDQYIAAFCPLFSMVYMLSYIAHNASQGIPQFPLTLVAFGLSINVILAILFQLKLRRFQTKIRQLV